MKDTSHRDFAQAAQRRPAAEPEPTRRLAAEDAAALASSPRLTAQRQAFDRMRTGAAAQRAAAGEDDAPLHAQADEARGGLPAQLRAGMEALSGMDLSGVRVHRNSSQPAQLNALAYAQGDDIHLGPGQEEHLPHEAWHVVQQKQGRVREVTRVAGLPVNDDAGLEQEADLIGKRAMSPGAQSRGTASTTSIATGPAGTTQLKTEIKHTPGTIPFAGSNYLVGIRMDATLEPADTVTGSATTSDNYDWMKGIRAYYSRAGVIRGHLLNHDLGGYGVPENLYPISSMANSRHSDNVEQNVKGALSAAVKTNREIRYSVVVNQKGPNHAPYESADFECTWTDENGASHQDVISSQLNIDAGWGGKSKSAKKSPAKWRHGSRHGEEDMNKHIQNTKKISIDYSTLGLSPNELSKLKARSIEAKGITDAQDWDEAMKMFSNELDELATVSDPQSPPSVLIDGNNYLNRLVADVKKATASNKLNELTQLESARMMSNLIAIRKHRIFIQDGVDTESNIADESEDVEMN